MPPTKTLEEDMERTAWSIAEPEPAERLRAFPTFCRNAILPRPLEI